MALSRTKPSAIKSSKSIDLTKTKYLVFCERSLSIPVDSGLEYFQALAQSGDVQNVEVYGVTPSNAENGTLEVGGRQFFTSNGEKRLTAEVMAALLSELDGYDYYIDKGILLVSEDDNIRGIPSGDNITPIPLSQVWGGDIDPANDGTTANAPMISLTMDGKESKKIDEWCLGFDYGSILNPTEETILTLETGSVDGITYTVKDVDGNNVVNTELSFPITTNIDDYVEYSDDDSVAREITSISATSLTYSPDSGGSSTRTVTIKSALLINGQKSVTGTYTG